VGERWVRALAGLAGYVAVREYGQRLAYALHGFEQRHDALEAKDGWDHGIAAPLQLVPGAVAAVGQVLEPFVAHGIGVDGTWNNGRDGRGRFAAAAAAGIAAAELSAGQRSTAVGLEAQATSAYNSTLARLGVPIPPGSPHWDAFSALLGGTPDASTAKDAHDGLKKFVEGLRAGPR
jgi:hypothetical protein